MSPMASNPPTASISLSPNGTAARAGWRVTLSAFWTWWRGELTLAFAPLAKRFWDDPANVVTLTTDGAQLEPLLTRVRITDRGVSLLVQPSLALRKTVSYPAAVAENLQDVIANDLDRQTPFSADQTYFGWRVLRR